MKTIRRIIVAVADPEQTITPALAKALAIARACDAQLELFHAMTMPISAEAVLYGGVSMSTLQRDLENAAHQRLEALIERLATASPRVVPSMRASTEWDLPAYEALIRRALATRADLIVADRRIGRHIAPTLMHYGDWELLRLSPIPVLLVKNERPYERPVVLAAVDPSHQLERPARLDGEILRTAQTITATLRGTLHVVHAFSPVASEGWATGVIDSTAAVELNRQLESAAARRFERSVRPLALPPRRRHLVDLAPTDAIESVVREINSDIVVMGAISRRGLRRLMFGNTAESLLDRLHCDLLIVKPKGFKSKLRRRPTGPILLSTMPTMM